MNINNDFNIDEKEKLQQELENEINENPELIDEEIENLMNEDVKEENNQSETSTKPQQLNSLLNSETILQMMGGIVQGAYASLPKEQAQQSINMWYSINKGIMQGLDIDTRLSKLKFTDVPDSVAFGIAGVSCVASTIIFVNSGKKATMEYLGESKTVETTDDTND